MIRAYEMISPGRAVFGEIMIGFGKENDEQRSVRY